MMYQQMLDHLASCEAAQKIQKEGRKPIDELAEDFMNHQQKIQARRETIA